MTLAVLLTAALIIGAVTGRAVVTAVFHLLTKGTT